MNDFDSPWKHVCDHFFPEMLALVLPMAHQEIDWTQPYRMRDKELPKPYPAYETGTRYADKLIEVQLKNGGQKHIFIHIEFQNQVDPLFSERMYTYNFRIYDKFHQHPVSIAILGDSSPNWRPGPYQYEIWGFDLSMTFPIIKLLDYRDRVAELTAATNPFAEVILAFLAGQACKGKPRQRFTEKLSLVRRLYQKQFSRDTIINLFQFIDWTLQLPPYLAQKFRTDLETLEGEINMPYITSIERMARKEGREEGRDEERRKQQAERRLELIDSLNDVLTHRFGNQVNAFRDRIDHADVETIRAWLKKALTTTDLVTLFQKG